jgi:FAD/FMN-containing dehydrogenase
MTSKQTQLGEIVGAGNVVDDAGVLEAYSRDHSFAPTRRPRMLVRPQTTAQVQALVQWANQTATPLVTVSSGAPHFNGDTVPSVPEAVIVDLGLMKKVLRVDRRNKIVVVEPGVTYAELEPLLAGHGMRIPRPLLPRANKSVVASLLERQPTLIPRLNYSLPEPLRVCGVVWGTGEIAFTGEAGMAPLSLEKQWKAGLASVDSRGPMATDLMRLVTGAQGSMGIVVWASIKCELIPSTRRYVSVSGARLERLIDFCYQLEKVRLGDEVLLLNATQMARVFGQPSGDGQLRKQDVAPWTVLIGLAGVALYAQERVEVQEQDLKKLAQEFGLQVTPAVPGRNEAAILKTMTAYGGEPFWKLSARGGCQDIFFLTTLDKAPRMVEIVWETAAALKYPTDEIGVYIQPQHQGTSQHLEFSLPYDPGDAQEVARMKEVYREASAALIAQGAYFSRPYGEWADLVYSRDATACRVLKAVKRIVDPNNVLNPGKLCF